MKSPRTILPVPQRAEAPAARPATAEKPAKMAITTLRFQPATLAGIKKAAIDRGESMQQLIETALAEMFERDGAKVPGLRRSS